MATVTVEVRAVEVGPATIVEEPAISDLRLDSRCVRATAGRVRVGMTMRLAQAGDVQVRVDRTIGSRGRKSCRRAAAVTRRVTLDLHVRPGLYRLTVRVGSSPPVRRFLRVVG